MLESSPLRGGRLHKPTAPAARQPASVYVAVGTAAFERLQFFAVNLRGFVACFRVFSSLWSCSFSLSQGRSHPALLEHLHVRYTICTVGYAFTFAVKLSFTQLAVEGLTVVLTYVFSSFFQVQTVVQIVGIPKPQIIEDFVQVQTESVFRSALLNKASTLQCLRSRSHCRNVPALSSGAHLGEHR